jgi:uncharacterized protein (DUF1499 family)
MYPINDVTTSPERPPAFREIAKLEAHKDEDLSYNMAWRKRQRQLYPELDSPRFTQEPDKIFDRALALVRQQGWNIINADEANFRIEAVATTPVLKLLDDVVIEVRPEPDGSSFHMRSKSRIGTNDLGTNHKRIKAFLDLLQK